MAVNVGLEEAEAAEWDWTVSSCNPASCRVVNQPGQNSQCCKNSWVNTCWLPVLGRTIVDDLKSLLAPWSESLRP